MINELTTTLSQDTTFSPDTVKLFLHTSLFPIANQIFDQEDSTVEEIKKTILINPTVWIEYEHSHLFDLNFNLTIDTVHEKKQLKIYEKLNSIASNQEVGKVFEVSLDKTIFFIYITFEVYLKNSVTQAPLCSQKFSLDLNKLPFDKNLIEQWACDKYISITQDFKLENLQKKQALRRLLYALPEGIYSDDLRQNIADIICNLESVPATPLLEQERKLENFFSFKNQYNLITPLTDFTDPSLLCSKSLLWLVPNDEEGITVSVNDIENVTSKFDFSPNATQEEKNELPESYQLTSLTYLIGNKFSKKIINTHVNSDTDSVKPITWKLKSSTVNLFSLSDYQSFKIGNPKLLALTTALLIGKLVQDNKLPSGRVHLYHLTAINENTHPVVVYALSPTDGQPTPPLYLIDPVLAVINYPLGCIDLKDSEQLNMRIKHDNKHKPYPLPGLLRKIVKDFSICPQDKVGKYDVETLLETDNEPNKADNFNPSGSISASNITFFAPPVDDNEEFTLTHQTSSSSSQEKPFSFINSKTQENALQPYIQNGEEKDKISHVFLSPTIDSFPINFNTTPVSNSPTATNITFFESLLSGERQSSPTPEEINSYELSQTLQKKEVTQKLQKLVQEQNKVIQWNFAPTQSLEKNIFILMHYRFIKMLRLEGDRDEQLNDFVHLIHHLLTQPITDNLKDEANTFITSHPMEEKHVLGLLPTCIYSLLRQELLNLDEQAFITEWQQYHTWCIYLKSLSEKLPKKSEFERHQEVINFFEHPEKLSKVHFNFLGF